MAEYIEREELLKQMRDSKSDKPKYGDWDIAHDCCIDITEKIPAADVVEVVHCKDCKHYENGVCQKIYYVIDGYYCGTFDLIKPKDFCSYGERMDGKETNDD